MLVDLELAVVLDPQLEAPALGSTPWQEMSRGVTPRRAKGAACSYRGGSGPGRAAPRRPWRAAPTWASIIPSISARRSSATSSSGRRSVLTRPRIALTGVRTSCETFAISSSRRRLRLRDCSSACRCCSKSFGLRHRAATARRGGGGAGALVLPVADARVLEGERRDHVLAPPDRERDRRAGAHALEVLAHLLV